MLDKPSPSKGGIDVGYHVVNHDFRGHHETVQLASSPDPGDRGSIYSNRGPRWVSPEQKLGDYTEITMSDPILGISDPTMHIAVHYSVQHPRSRGYQLNSVGKSTERAPRGGMPSFSHDETPRAKRLGQKLFSRLWREDGECPG